MSHIVKGLMNGGMDIYTPCAVIEHGTTPAQKKILGTLNEIEKKAGRIEIPAIIIVGGVCELSEKFDWYSKLPLHGKTIAVTRHENSSSGLSSIPVSYTHLDVYKRQGITSFCAAAARLNTSLCERNEQMCIRDRHIS